MGQVVLLLSAGIALAVVALAAKALKWLLIVAVVVFVAGLVTGRAKLRG
ncbi:MAG TPA: hypothetical protein VE546_15050 [Streptomyces sp.]|nr:hypothetical protein [Streptomyces sp.]HZG04863.1 hypothetical protein [Streptomyces sp.]